MTRAGTRSIDLGDPRGAAAAHRLGNERIAWLTTVAPDGTPQTSPIWFIRDGEDLVLYSRRSLRVRNLRTHDRVSVHLEGNGLGGDIVIVEGTAQSDSRLPSAAENGAYLAKYGPLMAERDWAPEWFAAEYPVPIRITPTRYRYW